MDLKASDNVPSDAVNNDVINETETGAPAGPTAGEEKAMTMKTTDSGTDVLIGGGGFAGLALGIALVVILADQLSKTLIIGVFRPNDTGTTNGSRFATGMFACVSRYRKLASSPDNRSMTPLHS